jgi:hypothetical protein
MKRSAMKPSTKPMKRTAMKKSRPKTSKIRQSAKGQKCTLKIEGVCTNETETVVWAHSNETEDGKGIGIKARDEEGCFACFSCHAWYDGGYVHFGVDRDYVRGRFNVAREVSQAILKTKGLM